MITTIGLVTITSVTIYSYRFFSCDENLYDLLSEQESLKHVQKQKLESKKFTKGTTDTFKFNKI